MRRLSLALLLGLGACASLPPSYVAPDLSAADGPVLAQGVAGFLSLRGGGGAISIDAPAGDNVLGAEVDKAVRAAGFTVASSARQHLSYQIDQRPGGALVRVSLDGTRGARAYTRAVDGSLAPAGPYTITLAEAR